MAKTEAETVRKGHTYYQWAAAILANLITLSFGMEYGWISPVTKYLQSDASPTGKPLSDSDIAWVACSLSMTAAFGVPIYAYIADVYGCKIGVILLTIPQALCWLIKIFFSSKSSLILARAISGISAGGLFNVIPMYVKEISQDNMRGVFGSILVLFQNIGMLIMYIIGAYMDYYTVMYISMAIPIILGLLLIKAPQSPLLLVKQGKIEAATEAVAFLRGLDKDDKAVLSEIAYMKTEEERFRALPDISMKAIIKDPSWRRGLVLIFITFTFHALSGAFIIFNYASSILVATGVEFNISPELQTVSLPALMIISSLLLMTVVEKCGRKILLTGAFFMTFVSMTTLGGVILTQRLGGSVPGWLPVFAMAVAVSMYACGVSPIPYIVMTEVFSYQIRAKVMGCIVTYAWFGSFISLAAYTPMYIYLGEYTTFFIFGAINLIASIFVIVFLPETRGKNDEEIRKILCRKEKRNQKDST